MKTLLTILGSLTVGVTPAVATCAPLTNQSSFNAKPQDAIWSAPTSMQALQEGLDRQHEAIVGPVGWYVQIEETVRNDYDYLLNDKTGTIDVKESIPVNETVENTFQDVYANNTPNQQTFQTQSYSKQITNTSTFTVQLQEQVTVELKTNFWFAETKVGGTFSSSQAWTSTETVTETVTAPSQSFTVDPYSKGIATYIIKSGTYNVDGVIRYYMPLSTILWTTTYDKPDNPDEEVVSAAYTLSAIIEYLNEAGYGDMLRMNYREFSVISTDNPDNPSTVCFNIPINYVSNGGKLDVNFTQEPIN